MKISRCFRRAGLVCSQLLLAAFLCGCTSTRPEDPINPKRPYAFPGQIPSAAVSNQFGAAAPGIGGVPEARTFLRSGDTIVITFSDLPPERVFLPVTTELDKDGKVTLHYNVTVLAAGKNLRQLEQEIRTNYVPKYFKYLTVTVRPDTRYYHVNGEVKLPSMYPWRGDPTVLRAIAAAGGVTDWARPEAQLTRSSGEQFIVKLKEAQRNPRKDLPVYPGDYIYVPRKSPIGP